MPNLGDRCFGGGGGGRTDVPVSALKALGRPCHAGTMGTGGSEPFITRRMTSDPTNIVSDAVNGSAFGSLSGLNNLRSGNLLQ